MTPPFQPVRCDVYVDNGVIHTADVDCCSRYDVFRVGFDPSETQPAFIIPAAHMEAVERVVKAQLHVQEWNANRAFPETYEDALEALRVALESLVTTWRTTP